MIIGQALEDVACEPRTTVKALVGLPERTILASELRRLRAEIDGRLARLEASARTYESWSADP